MENHSTIVKAIQHWLARVSPIEPIVLIVLAVGISCTWGFIKIADEVFEGETQAFDRWALQVMRDSDDPTDLWGPLWFEEIGRDATALGGVAWLTFTTLVIAIYLWLDDKVHMMVFTVGAATSGALISIGLKSLYDRPRPDLVTQLSHVYSSSFPSGHSMLSAIVYLTVGSLLAAVMPTRPLKIYVLSVAIILTLSVGLSRVYLGVHYPTDVLAGWLAGLVWSLLCWLLAHWLQRRGTVEQQSTKVPSQ